LSFLFLDALSGDEVLNDAEDALLLTPGSKSWPPTFCLNISWLLAMAS
jgi:hypothetical protein